MIRFVMLPQSGNSDVLSFVGVGPRGNQTKEATVSKKTISKKRNEVEGAKFVRYFGPLLDALRELGGSGTPKEVTNKIAENLELSDDELNGLLDSGMSRFANQVAWARQYLVWENYLDSSRRGVWTLTEKGRGKRLTNEEARAIFLERVRITTERRKSKSIDVNGSAEEKEVPASAGDDIDQSYKSKLLTRIKSLTPAGFERLAQRLLREADFEEVNVTGRPSDGGIDGNGVLRINPFMSFQVLFQCKKYANSVSPSHVRDFRGAMQGRADKGIIITTGTFTSEARREATRDGVPPIELVDGERLVEMFERLELGLSRVTTFVVDDEFFDDYQ